MHKKQRHLFLPLLSLALVLSLAAPLPVKATGESEQTESETASQSSWPEGPELTSPSACLIEDSTGTILYEKSGEEVRYPGSIVKIMTTLVALENSSLTDQVTFTQTGVSAAVSGSVNIASKEGEILTMEQCLYAIMLGSANDVCVQVAEHIAGSVDAFVEKMNARAAELGCSNTVFTNPTGLHDDNQHSTAYDLALIVKAAIDNETFRTISQTKEYTIPATNMTGTARTLKDSFPLSAEGSSSLFEGILAGKTGYTQASGSTLAAAANQNGVNLIAVVLAGTTDKTPADATALLNYGFQNFQVIQYSDEASTLSGGFAVLPNGVSADQIQTSERESEEGLRQEYYYDNRLIGSGIIQTDSAESLPELETIDNEAYLESLAQKKSMTPYFVIAGTGLVLLILLGVLLRKVLKS